MERLLLKPQRIARALSQLRLAASHYDTSLFFQASRARTLHNNALFSLEDILYWGLTDPKIAKSDLDSYMSKEARVRLQQCFDQSADRDMVDDKARFYEACVAHDVDSPLYHGILSSESADSEDVAELKRVKIARLPDGEFVAKPRFGCKGKGISFFEKKGDVVFFGRNTTDCESAAAKILLHGKGGDFVIQSRVKPHSDLAELSGTSGIQSIRLVTFLAGDSTVYPIFARFKVLVGDNLVDNFADGTTGNLIAAVDTDQGLVTACHTKTVGEIGLTEVTRHPETQRTLNFTVPDWDRVIELTTKGARCFSDLRLLAWDVGMGRNGPVILEANQEWEIFPISPYKRPPDSTGWSEAIRRKVRA